jgi:hypothetical protein
MSYPSTFFLSSSVTHVDTSVTSKILMLPTASTIKDISLYIRDATGNAATNTIFVSTQSFDLIDQYASTISLTNNYQSIRFTPFSDTRYAITLNFNDFTPYTS